jgi:hypothetical protein
MKWHDVHTEFQEIELVSIVLMRVVQSGKGRLEKERRSLLIGCRRNHEFDMAVVYNFSEYIGIYIYIFCFVDVDGYLICAFL